MRRIFVLCTLILFSACQSNIDGDTYAVKEAGQMSQVFMGRIISRRQVEVMESRDAKDQSGVGTVAGAAVGGIAASGMGQGRGSAVAAIGGAVVGGVIGHAIDKKIGTQKGYEYIIELDEGRAVSITQGDDEVFSVGQEVLVLYSDYRGGHYQARIIAR